MYFVFVHILYFLQITIFHVHFFVVLIITVHIHYYITGSYGEAIPLLRVFILGKTLQVFTKARKRQRKVSVG